MTVRASAARYARALLDVAITESAPEQVERDLTAFLELTRRNPDLQRALTHPAVAVPAKRAVVGALVERLKPVPPVARLLLLLADRDRLVLLPDLVEVYRDRLMDHRRIVRAEVTTAVPLSESRLDELRRRLAESTGRSVVLTTKVDPSLIGGMVTRIGSLVFDGSLANQLARVRKALLAQTALSPGA